MFDAALVRSSPSFAVGNAALAHLEAARRGPGDVRPGDRRRGAGRGAPAGRRVADRRARRRVAGPPGRRGRPLGPARSRSWDRSGRRSSSSTRRPGPSGATEARAARAAFRHPGGGRVRLTALELPVADAAGVAREYGSVLGIAFDEGWRAAVGSQSVVLRAGGVAARRGAGRRSPARHPWRWSCSACAGVGSRRPRSAGPRLTGRRTLRTGYPPRMPDGRDITFRTTTTGRRLPAFLARPDGDPDGGPGRRSSSCTR